jgi:Family of unknown function (DUF5662)
VNNDFLDDLVDHKDRVSTYMSRATGNLIRRSNSHDNSKFGSEEFEAYNGAFAELQQYTYGTEEYRAALRKIKPAIKHHYSVNDHHPEYHEHGVADMNLIQVLEMVCDWMAASDRSGSRSGFDINKTRFGIDDQLFEIIMNTVKYIDSL